MNENKIVMNRIWIDKKTHKENRISNILIGDNSFALFQNSQFTFGIASTWHQIMQTAVIATDDVCFTRFVWRN